MVLATAGALAIGDYTEGAEIVVLFAIAAWLEESCGRRARDAVSAVIAMQPATATLADSGEITQNLSSAKAQEVCRTDGSTCFRCFWVFSLGPVVC